MYTKKQQTAKKEVTHKVCKTCGKKRAIRFFSSKRALICSDCKRRKWRKDLRNSPGKVNKKKDAEWSEAVKERDGHKCVKCGKTTYLNSHHIYSRSNHAIRWDLDNGIALCSGCHTMSSKFSAHKTPMLFYEFLLELKGQDFIDRLREKARTVKKVL